MDAYLSPSRDPHDFDVSFALLPLLYIFHFSSNLTNEDSRLSVGNLFYVVLGLGLFVSEFAALYTWRKFARKIRLYVTFQRKCAAIND